MDGTPFGRYRLVELLGHGGMGEVWRAHDTEIDRTVAIKMLLPHFAQDKKFEQRFRREARAAARLENPHVVPIYDVGEIDGRLFVAMRLIRGQDLETLLDAGPLEPQRAVAIIGQIAKALHAAHKVGLIHRDIKPSNILLDEDDNAYLIDFGIARAAGETGLTSTGATIGTWSYMAPERFSTGQAGASSDIYALACVLYECLTGERPYPAVALEQIAMAHMVTPPPQPSAQLPTIPAAMDDVIATGLAKEPARRYASTVELAEAARDAITTPIRRPAPAPTLPATQQAPGPVMVPAYPFAPPQPAPTARAEAVLPSAARFASPAAAPAPAKRGRISRRTIALIAGAVALVAVIAAAIAIPALSTHGPSQSSPASSARSYGAQVVLPFTGLNEPQGVAVDGTSTLYVTDGRNNRVLKLTAGLSTQEVLPFTGLSYPEGVAVDGAGTLCVTDYFHNRVLKLAAGSSTQEVLPFTGLYIPFGVAVDSTGTVYVADSRNNRVLKLAAGSSTQQVLPFTGLFSPEGVAVDSAGTVYVTDMSNNSRVLKLAAGSSTQQVLPFTGLLNGPNGVAVDGSGTLYVADDGNNRVLKLAAGSSTQDLLPFSGLSGPKGVAVDSTGNVYVVDQGNQRVLKLPVR